MIQKTLSRFASVLLSLALVLSCMVPVSFADYSSEGDTWRNGNMWDMLMFTANNATSGFDWSGLVHVATGILSGKVCGYSPDKYHHSRTIGHVGGVDEYGRYTFCTCYYCGYQFKIYSSDFEYSYLETSQVIGEDFGTTVVSDDNTLVWSPSHDYTLAYNNEIATHGVYCQHHTSDVTPFSATFNCSSAESGVKLSPAPGLSSFTCYGVRFSFSGKTPITGSYMLTYTPAYEFTVKQPDHLLYSSDAHWGVAGNYNAPVYQFTAGTDISRSTSFSLYNRVSGQNVTVSEYEKIDIMGYAPVFRITPNNNDELLELCGIGSRPGNIPGSYGILDSNNVLVPVDTQYIVDEAAKTLTNPVTGSVYAVNSWDYDYSTRTYTLACAGGVSVSVAYGDSAVTIEDGGSVYTVYYLVPGSGYTPEVHIHDWTPLITNEATCTAPGSVTYSCSGCSETMTEVIPILEHDWQIKSETADSVLYECSRCKETRTAVKDPSGSGSGSGTPSPGGPGSDGSGDSGDDNDDDSGGGIFDFLGEIFDRVTGFLGGALDKAFEGLKTFFGGLLDTIFGGISAAIQGLADLFGGILGVIVGVLSKFVDSLISLAEFLRDGLLDLVSSVLSLLDEFPAVFFGFLDFVQAMFPFLPAEGITAITFGITAVIFITILKLFKK